MVVETKGSRRSSASGKWRIKFPLFHAFYLFVLSLCALLTTLTPSSPSPYVRNSFSGKLATFYELQDNGEGKKTRRRRHLRGLGSSPPRCTSKCGRCTPCKPVHVPVPPGTPVTAEYYPEAWRCKCGNRLYMP